MTADNFKFDIAGAPLDQSLAIAGVHKVTGWRVDHENDPTRLVLYWAESDKATPLPAPLEGDALVEFVKAWLAVADYGQEPGIDGHCGKGWRVYTEDWGQVGHEWAAFVAVEPYWLLYGK